MATITGGVILSGGSESGSGLDAPFHWPGAPTNGGSGTYVGKAVVGSHLINTVNGNIYVASAATTPSTVTWTLVTP
jgi:hypothetical protein